MTLSSSYVARSKEIENIKLFSLSRLVSLSPWERKNKFVCVSLFYFHGQSIQRGRKMQSEINTYIGSSHTFIKMKHTERIIHITGVSSIISISSAVFFASSLYSS